MLSSAAIHRAAAVALSSMTPCTSSSRMLCSRYPWQILKLSSCLTVSCAARQCRLYQDICSVHVRPVRRSMRNALTQVTGSCWCFLYYPYFTLTRLINLTASTLGHSSILNPSRSVDATSLQPSRYHSTSR